MKVDHISMDKQYRTRDGHPVRVLCVDRQSDAFPVVALIGDNVIATYTADGRYYDTDHGSARDLIEVSPRVERWVNVYGSYNLGHLYKSRLDALVAAGGCGAGVLRLTYEGDTLIAADVEAV